LTPARDIGVYNAYGKQGWNDEVLLGAEETEPENQMQALLRDAQAPAAGGDAAKQGMAGAAQEANAKAKEEVERPAGRVSEADTEGDMKSLNRLLKRTLFLVVKGKDGRWTFPAARVVKNENMHTVSGRT
jgi:large subunit ribosomal protein L46